MDSVTGPGGLQPQEPEFTPAPAARHEAEPPPVSHLPKPTPGTPAKAAAPNKEVRMKAGQALARLTKGVSLPNPEHDPTSGVDMSQLVVGAMLQAIKQQGG